MESMVLTPRLNCIAGLVPQGARLADIGTDHAKLPISLLLRKRIQSATGSDIRKGPLAHAAKNAEEHKVKLSLILAYGLEGISPENCDTISIAGMGGGTIAGILRAAPWTAEGHHLLLLQPMTMVYELRQWLWANGYEILKETLCLEGKRWYVALSVSGGAAPCKKELWQCLVSPALMESENAAGYIRHLLRKEIKALEGMEKGCGVDLEKLECQRNSVAALEKSLEELQ